MGEENIPLDVGMPQERTLLSWQRTAMTLSIAGFALARLALDSSALLAGALAIIVFAVIMAIVMGSLKRYGEHDPTRTGGKTTAMLTLSTFSLAIIELVIVLKE